MAKREPNLGSPAPPSDPVEHPAPVERAHLWARPPRPDERPVADPVASDYETPRWVHKDGAQKRVETSAECADALADGWLLHPAG